MFLGYVQNGGWLTIPAHTGTAWPSDGSSARAFPTMSVFDVNGDVICQDEYVPPVPEHTGLHQVQRQIGPEFTAGRYSLLVSWQVGSNPVNRREFHTFEVRPGGESRGAYVGLQFFAASNADFVVGMLDCGRIETRKGPVT